MLSVSSHPQVMKVEQWPWKRDGSPELNLQVPTSLALFLAARAGLTGLCRMNISHLSHQPIEFHQAMKNRCDLPERLPDSQ
jgi:hypothetical protein